MTGVGFSRMILRKKVNPSMRGISISRIMTSGHPIRSELCLGEDRIGGAAVEGDIVLILQHSADRRAGNRGIIYDKQVDFIVHHFSFL